MAQDFSRETERVSHSKLVSSIRERLNRPLRSLCFIDFDLSLHRRLRSQHRSPISFSFIASSAHRIHTKIWPNHHQLSQMAKCADSQVLVETTSASRSKRARPMLIPTFIVVGELRFKQTIYCSSYFLRQ